MFRIGLSAVVALCTLAACSAGVAPTGSASGGTSAGAIGSSSGGGSGGSTGSGSSGGSLACLDQPCGSGCCQGTYCWGGGTCLQNGTCPGAGVLAPTPGLCSCDGSPAVSCPAGQTCPTPVHGHATYCSTSGAGSGGSTG